MASIAIRECLVVALGVMASFAASLVGDPGRDGTALAAAVLIPVAFCLIRAGSAPRPLASTPRLRRVGSQFCIATAISMLLVFEMLVAMLAGAREISLGAWVVVVVIFCLIYVTLFTFGHVLGGHVRHATLMEGQPGGLQ